MAGAEWWLCAISCGWSCVDDLIMFAWAVSFVRALRSRALLPVSRFSRPVQDSPSCFFGNPHCRWRGRAPFGSEARSATFPRCHCSSCASRHVFIPVERICFVEFCFSLLSIDSAPALCGPGTVHIAMLSLQLLVAFPSDRTASTRGSLE